jgi:hypothetical protein
MADKTNKQSPNFVMDGTAVSENKSQSNILLRSMRGTNSVKQEEFEPGALKKLSEVRRAQIHDAISKKTGHQETSSTVVGVGLGQNLQKKANFNFGSTNTGGGGVDRLMPEIYSPLFQMANLNLPRDRMTMNAWNRVFTDTHPIVKNAITLHSTYPISKINVKCKHRKVEQFFNDMAERLDLFNVIADVAYQFWSIGEVFPYAELDENTGMWSSIVIQNPDYVTVKKSTSANVSVISLRADEVLKKAVTSNHPSDMKLRAQIPDNIIHHIRKNEPIPLDNFNVSHLKMLSNAYDSRGTSMIVSCYKMLMWWDKLLDAEIVQADGFINPVTMISVGGTGDGGEGMHPSSAQLEEFRQVWEQAQWDKDFKIITHGAIKVERIGASGAIIDTSNKFNFIREMLYAGLMVPKAVMDTEGSAYASASVGLEVLRTRYITFRNMLEKWLEKKIFAPISQIQGFFEFRNGEKVLIVPEVDWNHINLYDLNDYIQALGGYVDKKQISVHTLYRSLGLNWEEEQRMIREEMVRAAIMEKETAELKKMSLIELRALDADEQITESVEEASPVPGETPDLAGGESIDTSMPPMPTDITIPSGPSPSSTPPGAPPAEAGPSAAPTPAPPPPKT